jgi:hypothetical protein
MTTKQGKVKKVTKEKQGGGTVAKRDVTFTDKYIYLYFRCVCYQLYW